MPGWITSFRKLDSFVKTWTDSSPSRRLYSFFQKILKFQNNWKIFKNLENSNNLENFRNLENFKNFKNLENLKNFEKNGKF